MLDFSMEYDESGMKLYNQQGRIFGRVQSMNIHLQTVQKVSFPSPSPLTASIEKMYTPGVTLVTVKLCPVV